MEATELDDDGAQYVLPAIVLPTPENTFRTLVPTLVTSRPQKELQGSKSKLETATPQQLLALIKKQQAAFKKSQAKVEGTV
jgi:hypothetical protein